MQWLSGRNRNVKHTRINKWYNYLEAWHLLKPKQEEIVFSRSLPEQSIAIG
jgi:hypothetical protein